jgi:hypothetical protein
MFRRGTRLSLASCRRQLILIGAFCAVSIYPQSVFGQRELPIPAKGQQLATAATSRTREVPLPGGELLLFGLLGLALTVAALSVWMVCSSSETPAVSSRASQKVNAPEQTVLSHLT